MDFGETIRELKKGSRVARRNWNGKGMFIYLVRGRVIDKELLRNEASHQANYICDDIGNVHFNSHIDMFAADGTVVVGWLASQTDMLADDWDLI